MGSTINTVELLASAFIWLIALLVIAAGVMFVIDRFQTADAIRRNFPVIGRFRGVFTRLGEFFRQYFYAMDREEMPFNRAQREWAYRAASGGGNTVAFGSTRNLAVPGTPIFVNAPFPPLSDQYARTEPLMIGPGTRQPFLAPSLFNISGMSFGALSRPAIEALSHGAREAGIWMNTGEGGLSEAHLDGGCDIVFQIGTAKYGVRDAQGGLSDAKLQAVAAHEQVRMFEIKLAQGAKPGKGGILPAAKITAEIAAIRGIERGKDSLSPNRHAEAGSFAELLDMIGHVRAVTGKPVGIKTVAGSEAVFREFLETIVDRGAARAPDFITLDGGEGGTGAAPMEFIDHVGVPMREGLMLVHNTLVGLNLRDEIRIGAAGKIITAFDIARTLALGADWCNAARGFMFALGCIQSQTCHTDTCPTGVATQDKRRWSSLRVPDKAERVKNFHQNTLRALKEMIAAAGLKHPGELGPEHIIRRVSGKEIRSLGSLYAFVSPGALIDGLPHHAVFQQFWESARADSFAPPPGIAELRWSKKI